MSDFFGRRFAGPHRVSFALGSVTSALGPVLMGWVADRTGQYKLAFLGGTVVNGLVLLLGIWPSSGPSPQRPVA